MKKYNEPEFKVVMTKNQDVITTSGGEEEIPHASSGWEVGGGTGAPIISL